MNISGRLSRSTTRILIGELLIRTGVPSKSIVHVVSRLGRSRPGCFPVSVSTIARKVVTINTTYLGRLYGESLVVSSRRICGLVTSSG